MLKVEEKERYSVKETSTELGMSTKTVYKLINNGDIAVVYFGGTAKITKEELERYKKEGNAKKL